jgi:hypothetical protein
MWRVLRSWGELWAARAGASAWVVRALHCGVGVAGGHHRSKSRQPHPSLPPSLVVANQERQLLLEVAQSVLYIERASVNVRKLCVTLPMVKPDGARVVWCPRCPRGSLVGRSQTLPAGSDPVPDLCSSSTATSSSSTAGGAGSATGGAAPVVADATTEAHSRGRGPLPGSVGDENLPPGSKPLEKCECGQRTLGGRVCAHATVCPCGQGCGCAHDRPRSTHECPCPWFGEPALPPTDPPTDPAPPSLTSTACVPQTARLVIVSNPLVMR